MMKTLTLPFLLGFFNLLITLPAISQEVHILPLREQARVIDQLLEERVRTVLPSLMRREGIDMWLVMASEYNEDPVIETLLPATWMAARRTTMLVMFDQGAQKGIECLAVARYDVGTVFKRAWDPDGHPDQWARLAEIIKEKNPKKIAVNRSHHYSHADGLTSSHYEKLMQYLPKKDHGKVVSAERLAVGWLETRTPTEMAMYPMIVRMAHQIIAEGFSEKVIQPGVTTTEDVVWWYRERIAELKLQTWFQPTVSIQREEPEVVFAKRPNPKVILPGDLLHVDFGITYLRLNTDTQQHAYVLKPGEKDAPEYLKNALKVGNRLQDILTGNFAVGKTGNEILAASRRQALAEGIEPSIYTHPIGYHGHAAGTTIGMWDAQEGVPHTGDYPMKANTAYSIELNATVPIKEWNKTVKIQLEEDAYFDGEKVWYIGGRQTELMVIPRPLNGVE
jgi:Xaa-Pro aminopeptidase